MRQRSWQGRLCAAPRVSCLRRDPNDGNRIQRRVRAGLQCSRPESELASSVGILPRSCRAPADCLYVRRQPSGQSVSSTTRRPSWRFCKSGSSEAHRGCCPTSAFCAQTSLTSPSKRTSMCSRSSPGMSGAFRKAVRNYRLPGGTEQGRVRQRCSSQVACRLQRVDADSLCPGAVHLAAGVADHRARRGSVSVDAQPAALQSAAAAAEADEWVTIAEAEMRHYGGWVGTGRGRHGDAAGTARRLPRCLGRGH